MTADERLPFIRVRPKAGGPHVWMYSEPRELSELVDDANPDDYEVEKVEMTEAEWDALPEFEGW